MPLLSAKSFIFERFQLKTVPPEPAQSRIHAAIKSFTFDMHYETEQKHTTDNLPLKRIVHTVHAPYTYSSTLMPSGRITIRAIIFAHFLQLQLSCSPLRFASVIPGEMDLIAIYLRLHSKFHFAFGHWQWVNTSIKHEPRSMSLKD